jgi:hypothetical protein
MSRQATAQVALAGVGPVTLNRLRQIPAAERARTTLAQAACPLPQFPARRPDEPLSNDRPVAFRMQRGPGTGLRQQPTCRDRVGAGRNADTAMGRAVICQGGVTHVLGAP